MRVRARFRSSVRARVRVMASVRVGGIDRVRGRYGLGLRSGSG